MAWISRMRQIMENLTFVQTSFFSQIKIRMVLNPLQIFFWGKKKVLLKDNSEEFHIYNVK